VVLAAEPRSGSRELIKRVAHGGAAGVELRGDRPASSTDSRHFGRLPASAIRWRVALRYWPLFRFGRVPTSAAPLALEPEGGEPACTAFEHLVAGRELST
jgi:hypothetical protein